MERDEGIYTSKNGQFTHQAVSDFIQGKLNRRETAERLQVRERSVTRLARRIESKGLFGVIHGNRDRAPSNKKCEGLKKTVMDLVEEKYSEVLKMSSFWSSIIDGGRLCSARIRSIKKRDVLPLPSTNG